MFPNPQDVLPMPAASAPVHQWVESLQRASGNGHDALRAWAVAWIEDRLAVVSGAMQRQAPETLADGIAAFVAREWDDAQDAADLGTETLEGIVARLFGFASWAAFDHLRTAPPEAPARRFERAVDCVVAGDMHTLAQLLRDDPALTLARSTRAHGATLLHYVSANGIENYRQTTPANIVELTRLLLDTGADVNATCDVYGGGATTLGLVITSAHPRAAGVQEALAALLLERGATIGDHAVRDCLANGCPEAAAFVAHVILQRGGKLRLDEAAGIGRGDLVASLLTSVSPVDPLVAESIQYASWYGHGDVLALLRSAGASG